jgi:predicted amidophosphoribosyltransferase
MAPSNDPSLAQAYISPQFVEAWAICNYSNFSSRIHTCKYGGYEQADREAAGKFLLGEVKDFIHKKWPQESRPFDWIVTPPQNLAREFNLTEYISSNLIAGNIRSATGFISKNREVRSMKNVSAEERAKEIAGAYSFNFPSSYQIPKGILVFDDVLGTGGTASEVARTLNQALPGIPLYYLAITYIKGQAVK